MYKAIAKHLIDMALALLALPVLIILVPVIGIAIKMEDGGPIFYAGPRLGYRGSVYRMYKFRTMLVDAPDVRNPDGSTYNSQNDPRVTRVGRFLRETSLDELPQMINVLKGEMSLIGPRPSLPDALKTYLPDEMPKLDVRPGITGYTQAYFRNSISVREKRLSDAWYAKHCSLLLDLRILVKTVATVVLRRSLYTN